MSLTRANPARFLSRALAAVALLIAPLSSSAQQMPQCRLPAALAHVPELSEASGVAASRTTPGRFWAHNDSSEPVLFALDSQGRITGLLRQALQLRGEPEGTAFTRRAFQAHFTAHQGDELL